MCSIVRFGVISSFLYEIETFIEWKSNNISYLATLFSSTIVSVLLIMTLYRYAEIVQAQTCQ